jgi:hypothetical protein
MTRNSSDWNAEAKRLLKSELVRRGITVSELLERLQAIGVSTTKVSLESKISRGTFSAAFLLQCLKAIDCGSIKPNVEYAEGFNISQKNEDKSNEKASLKRS